MSRYIMLTLSEDHARIALALLRMDGASDYVGKNTDLPWDEVSEAAANVETQLEQQGIFDEEDLDEDEDSEEE